jgi:hypothetical protein
MVKSHLLLSWTASSICFFLFSLLLHFLFHLSPFHPPTSLLFINSPPKHAQEGPEQELAARALWNLAFDSANHTRIAQGLTPLIQLLHNGTEGAKQASAKALSILAVSDKYSQQLVAGGCVEPLVRMLFGSKGEMEAAAGALANIAYDEESRRAIAASGAIGN